MPAQRATVVGWRSGLRQAQWFNIVYRTDKQIHTYSGMDCWWYCEVGHNGGKIGLNRNSPLWMQIKTFGHELVHAVHDYSHWLDRQADALKEEGEKTLRELEEKK